ncbi:GntR family transcriptional regulator [Micromonospora sp. NPDC050397]|uniref:GntR family transcriptional regulator n=1 Tax=Micromonospora sp. NPDC050397 TaxID=3364279 RepID=UPI00384E35AD
MIQTPKSQYEQIADLLRGRILDGTYPPGAALPSEPELSAELGVSRVTVNRAVGMLRASGLVRVRRGAGTFVRSLPRIVRDARARYARRTHGTGAGAVEVAALQLRSHTVYREIGRIGARPEVVAALRLPEGEDVLVRRRILFANDEPTQLADSYYAWSIAGGSPLEQADTGIGGSYSRLAEMGYDIVRFSEDVNIRMPSDNERKLLDLDAGQPVFDIVHIAWTTEDAPIEAAFHVMPGHLWTLRYDWDDPKPAGMVEGT